MGGTGTRWIGGSGGDGAEVFFDQTFGDGGVDVAGDEQHGVARRIVTIEEILQIGLGSRVEIFHRADDFVAVGVADGNKRLQLHARHAAQRNVFHPLAALVLDHVALVGEGFAEGGPIEQKPHARAFQPQPQLKLRCRQGFEVVGPIRAGGSVARRGPGLGQILEVGVLGDVLGALEHHVLEQVGEAGLAGDFVLRADLVPNLDVDDGHAVVDVQEDIEPVRQAILLEIDVGNGRRRGPEPAEEARPRRARTCRRGRNSWRQSIAQVARGHDRPRRRVQPILYRCVKM